MAITTRTLLAATIARYLLGFVFLVFGLNGFFHFIPEPPQANPLGKEFIHAILGSHFAAFFFAGQVMGGLLLLSGFFVPLALTVLAAELYNILAFHLTFAQGNGLALAVVPCLLWILVFTQYRSSFARLFQAKPERRALS